MPSGPGRICLVHDAQVHFLFVFVLLVLPLSSLSLAFYGGSFRFLVISHFIDSSSPAGGRIPDGAVGAAASCSSEV